MQECLGRGLSPCHVQPLQKKKVAVAAEVGTKSNESEGLVSRLIPMTQVRGCFSGLRMPVDDRRPPHPLAIDNAEIRTAICNRGPGIAAHRANEHSIAILQIVKAQIAREPREYSLRLVLRHPGQSGHSLKVDKAGELLRAQVISAVLIPPFQWQFEVSALDVFGKRQRAARKIFKQVKSCIRRHDERVPWAAEEGRPERMCRPYRLDRCAGSTRHIFGNADNYD